MLRIALCDDERSCREEAERLLANYMQEKNLAYSADLFESSSELLDAVERGVVHDVYLLDIFLPGVTGMSLATELRSRGIQSPVIFLTSSADHALEAFGVNAVHYLLKPCSQGQFFFGMEKAIGNLASHRSNTVVLKVENEARAVAVSRILYCESEDKYQRIYLEGGKRLLVRITAGELFRLLEEHGRFYRCGRAHIVNLEHLRRVTAQGAELVGGQMLFLPRATLAGLRCAFFEFYR